MPKRLKSLITIPTDYDSIIELSKRKRLTGYETEILLRIYWKKQSLNYISFYMDFSQYGRPQKYYSVRSINNFHKEAFMKIIGK